MTEKTITVLNVSKTLVNVLGNMLLPGESANLEDTAENRATVKTDSLEIIPTESVSKSEESNQESTATGSAWVADSGANQRAKK